MNGELTCLNTESVHICMCTEQPIVKELDGKGDSPSGESYRVELHLISALPWFPCPSNSLSTRPDSVKSDTKENTPKEMDM